MKLCIISDGAPNNTAATQNRVEQVFSLAILVIVDFPVGSGRWFDVDDVDDHTLILMKPSLISHWLPFWGSQPSKNDHGGGIARCEALMAPRGIAYM